MDFWDGFADGIGDFSPFARLGSAAAKIVADGWIAAWLSIWNAGLWLLRLVLSWSDAWLTPDLSANGPGHDLYQITFWIAGVLLLIIVMIQLGIAAFRRDGKGLARAGIGIGQFAVIVGGWIGYAVGVTAAFGGLTRAAMESLMNVTSWREWDLFTPVDAKTITEGGVAVLLGLLGLLVWLAAIGHLVILLVRAAALLILVATGPIAAAGLAYEGTRAWFWKTFRWFHAAVATPLIVVLVSGVGMKFTEGLTAGKAGSVEQTIGTAVPAIVLICVSVVSPLALFKLLAFVDPGTSSGAAMRAGMASLGGMQGILNGNPTAGVSAGGDTTSADGSAQTAGEASADEVTTSKAASAAQMGSSLLGPAGIAFAASIGALMKVGSAGASVLADVTNQEGIGNNTYQPDYLLGRRDDAARANREANGDNSNASDPDTNPPDSTPDVEPPPTPPPTPGPGPGPGIQPELPRAGDPPAGGGGGGSGGGTGAAAGTEAAEAAVVVL